MTRTPTSNALLVGVIMLMTGLLTWDGIVPHAAFISLASVVIGAVLHDNGVQRANGSSELSGAIKRNRAAVDEMRDALRRRRREGTGSTGSS